MDIQGPYSKFCPDDRVNFLNYYYTVYKLCELLEQDEFLAYFPMLKDREKRIEQDENMEKNLRRIKLGIHFYYLICNHNQCRYASYNIDHSRMLI